MVNGYHKSYKNYENSKGLFFIVDKKVLDLRKRIIELWESIIAYDSNEVLTPTLVPLKVLEESKHLNTHGDQIFKVNSNLCLRPETAQSIFSNIKTIRRHISGSPLKIHQCGRAYRNEKSTRGGAYRRNQFEQLELEVYCEKPYDFFQIYTPKVIEFFSKLGITTCLFEVPANKRPHYSKMTIDIYDVEKKIQLGCLNDRGNHDLYVLNEDERANKNVYEISLGLDRIVQLIINKNLN